ncbi:MFS transporter [Leptolyngbya sp. NK1-12]|uniref:MFS transporter n=2 Tax=Leptolyngbya sp. NK1-12 TaxID=2547451 RepID=A0AA96WNP7_9CYAN|nr:MFS transporter [Leptolyngbya sp. NK1-12]
MNLSMLVSLGVERWGARLAQVTTPGIGAPGPAIGTPEAASVLFSGPQFFIALVSGILLAFAIQLLLTNLSVAAGISFLGGRSSSDSSRDTSSDDSGVGATIRKISFGVGIWTLISVSIALFFACYLAVQLSLLSSANLGAIVGLVIWAAYFSLLVWVSSTTVGSLIGSVVQAATSGFQAVLGTATAALGGQAAKRQAVSTAEAVAAAVRNELGAGVDSETIRDSIETYVRNLRRPGLDLNRIQGELTSLLNDPEVTRLAEEGELRHIDRQTFLNLISQRTDLSKQEVNRLADLLEAAWQQSLGQRKTSDSTAELVEYLRSTQSGQLRLEELNAKVDRLLAERQQQTSSADAAQTGPIQQTLQSGLNTAIGLLVGRTDLNDMDLGRILKRLQSTAAQVTDQTQSLVGQVGSDQTSYSPIETDVEQYLLNTYSWEMDRDSINRDFRNTLYDPSADPNAVIEAVSRLNRRRFVELLTSRGVFTQSRIQEIADQLEAVRREVLSTAQAAREREIAVDLQQRIDIYLTVTPKEQLVSPDTLPAFRAIIEDADAEPEILQQRLASYNRTGLEQILLKRQDLTISERNAILDALDRTREQVLFESQSLRDQAKQRYSEFQQQLESYLRNTGKSELNPEGIKRDLQLLASDPATGMTALRYRAAQFDRDTLVQLLNQRQDLSETEINQILDQVESTWYSVVHAPSTVVQTVKDQYDQTLSTLADYLRRTNLEELDPDGIQRDLKRLFENPQEGALALRRRLSRIDRETLVRLLSQRPDLSEEQVNRTIDQILGSIQQIIRSPRRLALRTQQRVVDFEAGLEEYLRKTNKAELNPEGIKRDLRLLVESPKLGVQSLGERLSRMDRSTLIALLSQRQDMTPEEAERIVSNIESVRDQMLAQVKQVQARIQAVIDGIFARIRNYLNSLERPELNYDGIKHDIGQLFEDPQAGFEALRSRLSQVDRGTLVALLSSREDISEADANRIIDQIEAARTGVLQRAERIQLEAQRRLEAVKQQAQHQLEETRKAAAVAAWWLFATALVSAAAAALGGTLASS